MKRTLTILLFLFVASVSMGTKCGVKPVPTPIEPKDTADCPSACEKMRSLGCEEGTPLEDGTTCEKFCIDTQKSGHALRPSCVMEITACDQAESATSTGKNTSAAQSNDLSAFIIHHVIHLNLGKCAKLSITISRFLASMAQDSHHWRHDGRA